jgi:integrase
VRGAAKTTRTVTDNTAVRELKQVRAAIKWGQRTPGWREALVGVEFTLPDVEVVIRNRALTRNEVRRLLQALEEMPHLELFVRLAIATGARMSAILELTWDKVQWPVAGAGDPFDMSRINRRVIDLRPEAGEPTGLTMTVTQEDKRLDINGSEMTLTEPIRIDFGRGTGSKKRPTGLIDPRNMGLWFDLMHAYKHRDPSCPYVVQYHGRRIKSVSLERAYERASIAGAGIHTLKHTCCTLMLLAGVNPGDVAEHVGTSEKIIRQHYKNFLPDERAKVGAPLIF